MLYFLLIVSFVPVSGDIVIRQVSNDVTPESWNIRGIATYEHGGSNPRTFFFQCTSTINDGNQLFWSKKEGSLGHTQQSITGGVEFLVDPPVAADVGTFICSDGASDDEAQFVLTDKDPASLAATDSLTHYVGETVVIDMYASTLSPLTDDIIEWKLNNITITSGSFSNSKTTLTIPNAQLSDAGIYIITISNGGSGFSSSNTTLVLLETPIVTVDPVDHTLQEWEPVSLNCTASGSQTLSITWFKLNGDLPTSAISTTSTITATSFISTLTISDPRSVDSGSYYCNATDGVMYNTSNIAILTILDNTRLSYIPSGGSGQILVDPLLFVASSIDSFTVDCEGSGSFYWTGPSAPTNVSFSSSDNPYQYYLPNSTFNRLDFSSGGLTAITRGLYSCVSNEDHQDSVYITNENPAIFTYKNEIIVGGITDVVLKVYVDGIDPKPSSSDISWSFNGGSLPNAAYYSLQSSNTELAISNAPSNITIGMYQATVATAQGTNSISINISYYDPPLVFVSPEAITILEGGTAVFNCTVDSDLGVTQAWYNADNAVISDRQVLVLSNITSEDNGVYYCQVVDDEGIYSIRKETTLTVKYEPSRVSVCNNGTFSCHASSEIGESTSSVYTSVFVTSVISTVYSSDQRVVIKSTDPLMLMSSSPSTTRIESPSSVATPTSSPFPTQLEQINVTTLVVSIAVVVVVVLVVVLLVIALIICVFRNKSTSYIKGKSQDLEMHEISKQHK